MMITISGEYAVKNVRMKLQMVRFHIKMIWSVVKGKKNIEIFDRSISFLILQRALAIMALNFFAIIFSSQVISFFYNEFDFLDILFEITSAVGTVGLGLGISQRLAWYFKLLICLDMIIGKLGPVSIAMVLIARNNNKNLGERLINCPEEKIIVG